MKDKLGFTLIELLAVIVILSIIALVSVPIILNILTEVHKGALKNTAYGIISAAEYSYAKQVLDGNAQGVVYTYVNGVEFADTQNGRLEYKGKKPSNGIIAINEQGQVTIAISDDKYCAEKGYGDTEVTISQKTVDECGGSYVNAPKLTEGMTPVKWNGITWDETTANDPEWYDYNSKKWANVQTDDGSMWVWVPRYVYKITNGWHSNVTGTIDIKFSIGTDDTKLGTVTLDNDSSSNASNNKWTNHPAFTFGDIELTGIWVAKFEATASEGLTNTAAGDNVITKTVKIIPNVQSWRYINIGNMFELCRNMETNSVYGWGTSGNNLDTHMMKNIEWGAVAYLSKSKYGKDTEEIWINPANDYTTGCAGDTVDSAPTVGCINTYETINGVKASTTGNIYGVYDMSGGAWDRVAGYLNNGHSYLGTYGSQMIIADANYKDVYEAAEIDNKENNYELTVNKKGDSVWETSNNIGTYSWFGDKSDFVALWYARGGEYNLTTEGGIFNFFYTNGSGNVYNTFRPVILAESGL